MAQQVSGLPDLPTQARVDNEAIVQDVALSLQLHPALVQPGEGWARARRPWLNSRGSSVRKPTSTGVCRLRDAVCQH